MKPKQTQSALGWRENHRILFGILIGLNMKNGGLEPMNDDVRFRTRCYGKSRNHSDGPYISNTADILDSEKLLEKAKQS